MRMKRSLLPVLVLCGLGALAAAPYAADRPATAPMLRIETGQHGAGINKLAVSQAERVVVTASDDKTARAWSLSNGEPLAVMRGPIGNGQEGALYAIALSPSGRTVAAAGHTGLAWDGTASIYLFARDSGAWLGSIALNETPTDAINHLAFSPDGKAIAVGANDGKGLRLVLPEERRIRTVDPAYRDAIAWLDFAADGRLAASSLDGGVRLYDAAFRRLAQWNAEGGAKPWAVAFSPDGQRLAVGLIGTPAVVILSTANLTPLQTLTGAPGRSGDFAAVAWSADGGSVYAGGTYGEASGRKLVRRWPLVGGTPAEIAVGDDTVTDLKGLAGGGAVFASAEPAWGVIGGDDRLARRQGRRQADFRDAWRGGFEVSPDGARVTFGFARGGRQRARIDLLAGQLETGLPDLALPAAAKDSAGGVTVSDWRNGIRPVVAGRPVTLEPDERSRSVAVSENGGVALGTDYFVRFFRNGRQLWRAEIPAPAWAVGLASQGGREGYVVAALGDGSLRWLRQSDGVERLGFYAEPETGRWVAWTPEGLFDHGTGGESLIGYHQNQIEGRRLKGAVFVKVEQLYGLLYRRDLLVKRLRGEGETEIAALIAKVGDIRAVLDRGLPPILRLIEICGRIEGKPRCLPPGAAQVGRSGQDRVLPINFDSPEVTLRFEAEDRGGGNGPIVLRRQGAPVAAAGGAKGVKGKVRREERSLALQPGLNVVALSAFNAAREIETDTKERPTVALRLPPSAEKPWMRVLAIGIDHYQSAKVPALANAGNDARGMVEVLRRDKKREVFADVDAVLLTDAEASLAAINAAFERLARDARPSDLTVVFLAGHGVALDGKYYFLPYDLPDITPTAIAERGLTHERLAQQLGRLPTARTMVVLDTCFSGSFAVGDSILRDSRDQTLGRQISFASGRFILAGSSSQQEALDGFDGHGVLTGTLLKGLAGAADAQVRGDHDGKVNVLELGEYAKAVVPEVAAKVGRGHEQRPRWFFNGDDMFNVRSAD